MLSFVFITFPDLENPPLRVGTIVSFQSVMLSNTSEIPDRLIESQASKYYKSKSLFYNSYLAKYLFPTCWKVLSYVKFIS